MSLGGLHDQSSSQLAFCLGGAIPADFDMMIESTRRIEMAASAPYRSAQDVPARRSRI